MRFTRRLVAVTGALVMAAGAVAGAAPVGAAPSVVPAKTYKACANKVSGAIRLVVKGKKCKKGEIKLEWNAQGPAGMAGPVGPQGPPGAQGVPGPAGIQEVAYPAVLWQVHFGSIATLTVKHATAAARLEGHGIALIPLAAPTSVAGNALRLTEVRYCLLLIEAGNALTRAEASWATLTPSAEPLFQILTEGIQDQVTCYTLPVTGQPASAAATVLAVTKSGDGAIVVGPVFATWTPTSS